MCLSELGNSALAFGCEMPARACLFKETVLTELGEVVADSGFIPRREQVMNGVTGGCGPHLLKVRDGDQDVVAAVTDQFTLDNLKAIGCKSIKKLSGDVSTKLVSNPANAFGSVIRDRFNAELMNGVGNLIDVLVAACPADALALCIA